MVSFAEKLARAVERNGSHLCIGLDPDPALMPVEDAAAFLCAVVEATADLAACYKPNLAFYEALGRNGYDVLARVLDTIPRDAPVIGDAKRGDIGNTASAYARALYDVWGFDAVTVNPWGGHDAVLPFIERREHGVFLWCRSSNPGAGDFQDLQVHDAGEPRHLYEIVAERARAWNVYGNIGLVAGATYPAQLARLRELCPTMLFLVPGVGAQGGEAEAAVRAARAADGGGFIVNVSRQVLYASRGQDYAQAARAAARRARDSIEDARRVVRGER
jgi:orotidine-5'-phosphate decarboxylase